MKQLIHTILLSGMTLIVHAEISTVPMDCLIHPNKTVSISSPVSGVIDTISVDRSDDVKKDDVLAQLRSDVEQERYNVAQAKAAFEGDLESSKVKLELSKKEYERARLLYEDRAIPLADKERAKANLELARYEYENAVHRHEVLNLELNQAKASLELRKIRSPVDGVVVDRYSTPGEFIDSSPILKVAQLHPLRIEMISPVSYFDNIKVGMHANIIPEFGQYDDLVAEVVMVDKVIDAASGTFGVRLLLNNEDHSVPGGLKCKLKFFSKAEEMAYRSKQRAMQLSQKAEAQQTGTSGASDETLLAQTQPRQCAKLSGWKKQDALQQTLDGLSDYISNSNVIEKSVPQHSWLVSTSRYDNRDKAVSLMKRMRQDGIHDIALFRSGKGVSVSAGLFSSEQRAKARVEHLYKLGYAVNIHAIDTTSYTYDAQVMLNNDVSIEELKARLQDNIVISDSACPDEQVYSDVDDRQSLVSRL